MIEHIKKPFSCQFELVRIGKEVIPAIVTTLSQAVEGKEDAVIVMQSSGARQLASRLIEEALKYDLFLETQKEEVQN